MSILKKGQMSRSKGLEKILSLGIFMGNIKPLALTVQKLLGRLKYLKMGQTPRSRSQGKKK